jgi:hypothetical protein
MRHILALTLLCAAALPAAAEARAAGVRVADCVQALEGEDRRGTFEARARAARDSDRIEIRFTLQVNEPAARGWRRVMAPGLDEWLTSDPGVRRYTYAKTVQNLSAPASYRAVVRFRWLDGDGAAVKSARVTSATCRQPDLRPDLAPVAIDAAPGADAATRQYAVTVRNDGRTDAGAFAVGLRVGEEALDPLAVMALAPGEEQVLTFTGPACGAETPLTVTADPGDAVGERDEDDNVLVAGCLP